MQFSGRKLREARGRRNQTSVAAGLQRRGHGTTQTQVSRWEAGQTPRRYIIGDLAAELGVRVDDLYEASDDEEVPDMVTALLDRLDSFRDELEALRQVAA